LPFLEAVGGVRAPGVMAVVRGPDDLVEGKGFAAVVPAGEAEAVAPVARRVGELLVNSRGRILKGDLSSKG
jgi:hypothetical protein